MLPNRGFAIIDEVLSQSILRLPGANVESSLVLAWNREGRGAIRSSRSLQSQLGPFGLLTAEIKHVEEVTYRG